MLIVLLLGAALFTYLLIYRPEVIAVLLFTLVLANINIDLNSLPLNLRAIITIALFGRIIIDKSGYKHYPYFINITTVKCFFVFMLYVLFVSWAFDLFTIDLLKQTFSTCIAAFCVYHFFFETDTDRYLEIALVIAGIICFADLAYTYTKFGTFPVQRIYLQYTGVPAEVGSPDDDFNGVINHNFFGQMCGMCFIYLFNDFIKNKSFNKLLILLMPVMFLGVIMSTSRSALLAILLVIIFLIINVTRYKEHRKRVYKIASICVGAVIIGILLFSFLGKYLHLDSNFTDAIVGRLTEEPIAIVKKAFGYSYDINNMGSMAWREESSADAYSAFSNLHFNEQLFGIGSGGFLQRNLGNGLNPHNGILLILIENGVVGLCLYVFLIAGLIRQSLKLKNVSPSLAVLFFIIVYGIGQNTELTSTITFLFVANLIAENKFIEMGRKNKTGVVNG